MVRTNLLHVYFQGNNCSSLFVDGEKAKWMWSSKKLYVYYNLYIMKENRYMYSGWKNQSRMNGSHPSTYDATKTFVCKQRKKEKQWNVGLP